MPDVQLEIPEPLQPFAFLIGDWVGTFADGKTIDRQHFEWLHAGKFIKNRHSSSGERGEHSRDAIFAFDPNLEQVVSWYWDRAGGIETAQFVVEGAALRAEGEYRGPQSMRLMSLWSPSGTDAFDAEQYSWLDGEWRSLWAVKYVRETSNQS